MSHATDAREMLQDLYGTQGPARCRYTAELPLSVPVRPRVSVPEPKPVQTSLSLFDGLPLFNVNQSTNKEK